VRNAVRYTAGTVAAIVLGGSGCGASGAEPITSSQPPASLLPSSCADRAPRIQSNAWPATRRYLAPPGAIAIRLCRYGILPGVPLERSRLLTSLSVIGRIVGDFDKLPSLGVPAPACPADSGSEILALLAYPTGQRVAISTGLTGCSEVTNGDLNRSAGGFGTPRPFGPQLVSELERLTG
jgi:hypothetical protein